MDLLSKLLIIQNVVMQKQDAVLRKLKHANTQRNTTGGYNDSRRGFKGNGRSNGFAQLPFSHGGRGRGRTQFNG